MPHAVSGKLTICIFDIRVKTLHTGPMATPEVDALPGARTIAHAIAAVLRADIATGSLRPGERLLQAELARRFSVSTTPVREALGILQHEGLVRLHPQRGATVFVPSVGELHEHYEIRAALEALAAEKAALNFTAADAPPLQEILEAMHSCTDADRYIELNHRFHMRLYKLSGRERLVDLIDSLRGASSVYLQIHAAEGVPSKRLDREHGEILAACEARDPERAASATRNHLAQTLEHVTQDLRKRAAGHDDIRNPL
jgi:DNA-binding GntR family transcriptional regulator